MKKRLLTQKLNDLTSLVIKVNGSVEIFLNNSETDDYFDIVLNSENQSFEFGNSLILKNNDDDLFNFEKKSTILDSLIGILQEIKNKKDSKRNIRVDIYIKNIKNLDILGDNIKIETNSVALDKVEINCANLKVKTLESNIKILKIQSSNLKGLIDYNENNSNINISSNNSDLTINKLKFDGELSIRANNSNYNNCIYGDKNLGTFIANFNNSNITIN